MPSNNTSSDSYDLPSTPTNSLDLPDPLLGLQNPKNSQIVTGRLRALWPRVALPWPNSVRSRLFGLRNSSRVTLVARNEDLLRDKARERMARRRLMAREDSQLAAAAAAQRRVHDTSYREKHRKMIRFKDKIRRDEEYFRKHGVHHPGRQVREYGEELKILEDDRWLNAMPVHRRQGASRGI
ncbi:hypothetical protein C8F04DRAFT_1183466 [Mycena alexandri]|uniref:Uncharacterized protein n=1 Tax=Mycena alexandri TaxID=1745969 RepID=A0AAD6SWU3_9AGAR|nr:hypothetical protein C8F04DRAFT_1183466 [Mycena alexandri]